MKQVSKVFSIPALRHGWAVLLGIGLLLLLIARTTQAQTVDIWITKGDQSAKLAQQGSKTFGSNGSYNHTVTVDENSTYQTMDGFGFALTQGSAEVLMGLNSSTRNSLLQELFNPITGNAISVVRISIGASDLSNSSYSYNETSGDINMNNFSLAGPDQTYLIPILQDILAINPNIKVLATPWTAPRWMKTNGSWIGGSLQTQYYQAYANYFLAYLDAMAAQGIDIWAITPQNEPENPWNEPSMTMNSTEQKNFINNNLGPAIAGSSHSTKIIAFDHNCDNTAYPIDVLNNSSYVDGAAFHLYGGDISAMSTVKNATGKNVYFTEQYTDVNGSFGGDLGWHMQNVVVGSTTNWSKTVIEWNLATDVNHGPRTPGGCTECLGAITVNSSSSVTRNVSYYIISQVSKFVQPGAVRIGSNSTNNIKTVAFQNPDGSYAVVAYNNKNRDRNVKLVFNGQSIVYKIPKESVATFTWQGAAPPSAPAAPSSLNATPVSGSQIDLSWADNASNEASYTVERSPNGSSNWATIATLGANATSYSNTGLANNSSYHYRVQASNAGGTSGYSNTASATTFAVTTLNAFQVIQAEDYDNMSGVQTENCSDTGGGQNVGWTDPNDYIAFDNVDFGSGAASINARVASAASFNGYIEVRLNSAGGTLVGTVQVGNTGGWQSWETKSASISGASGVHNVFFVFKGGNGVANFNWFEFSTSPLTVPSPAIQSGKVYRLTNRASGKAADVSGASSSNGARIQQWEWTGSGGDNQKFKIEEVNSGEYRIMAEHSGKVMDVVNNSQSDGAEVQQWEKFDSPNQLWYIEGVGNGYYRVSATHSNKALTAPSNNNGQLLQQSTYTGATNQQWALELVENLRTSTEIDNAPLIMDNYTAVFPNPIGSGEALTLKLGHARQGSLVFSLLDLSGREVNHQVLQGGTYQNITLPQLTPGVYVVTLTGKTLRYQTRLLVQ